MRLLFSLLLLFLTACDTLDSPRLTYERYVENEKAGITSFDEFINSYSERKQEEIELSIVEAVEKNPEKNKESVKSNSLKIFQRFAKCKKLEFLSEEINGKKATVTYKSTDNCSGRNDITTEIIFMINENGWKIDEIDIKF